MKIFQKITLGFLSIFILLGSLGVISLWGNLKVKDNVDRIILEGENEGLLLSKIKKDFQKIELLAYQYLVIQELKKNDDRLGDKKKEIPDILSQLEAKISKLDESTQNRFELDVKTSRKSSESVNLEDEIDSFKIAERLQENTVNLKSIFENILNDNNLEEAEKEILLERIDSLYNEEINPLLDRYQSNLLSDQVEKKEIIQNYLDRNNLILRSFTVVSLIFSLSLGLYISYTIAIPIERLKKASIKVKQGNFDLEIKVEREDELGILTERFNQMVLGLKNTTISKSYLDNILLSLSDSLIAIDFTGKIEKLNPYTYDLLGYTEEELINKNIQSIVADSTLNIKQISQTKKIKDTEINYLTKNGEKIPIAFSSSIIYNENGDPTGIVCLGKDISKRKQIEKTLQESEERYALASLATNDGLWDWNLLSNEIYFSPRWKSLIGYEEESLKNSPDEWFNRVHPDYVEELTSSIIAHINDRFDRSNFETTYPILHKDRNYRWMFCRGIKVTNSENKIYRIVGSQTDITHLKETEEKLHHQSLYDGLTSLPNRKFFLEKLSQLFASATANLDNNFAILFIDLDRFKKINESLGHLVGDELLIDFSHRLKTTLKNEDTLARLGSDEFVILLEKIVDLKDAIDLAETIFKQLDKPFYLKGIEVFINASIGIAIFNNKYEYIQEILRDADTAMDRAKAKGKGNYVVFSPDMHLESITNLEIENSLRLAIDNLEFEVFYQPIVRLKNSQIVGFEALVRWQHPEKGRISPDKFIPIAEETGLIVPIGYWVMEEACRQMKEWQNKYKSAQNMTISVNLSPVQLEQNSPNDDLNCPQKIRNILAKTELKPQHLKLEITETTIMESIEKANRSFQEIKAFGIKLSMDDFGTGYSSLNYLNDLPIDTLKIDRSFIKELANNSSKLELTKTIINLAQNLKMETIAEGIETIEQQNLLTELNCEYGQGYLFSRPISNKDAEISIAISERLSKYTSNKN